MKRRTARILVGSGATVFTLAAAAIFYAVFFMTPHMRVQENIRNFEAVMPLAPADSVPFATNGLAQGLPATGTSGDIAHGEVYYGYYCTFCHGKNGDGEGPAGESYMPKPADLRGERLHRMNDGELLRAMLQGTGHEPVLARAVPPEAYASLLLFVRTLEGPAAGDPPTDNQTPNREESP